MATMGRLFRVTLLIPVVALAIVFDRLSALMHAAADRLTPSDREPTGA